MRREGIEDRGQCPVGVEGLRKIAGALGRRGKRYQRAGGRAQPQAFIVSVEVQVLSFQNGAAYAAAELIALETRLGDTRAVVVPAIGVEYVVSQKVEAGAVELIAPAFGHYGDDASVGAAILRVECGSGHLDFLHGVDRWSCQRSTPVAGLAGNAVDQDGGGFVAASVEGKPVVVLILRGLRDTRADGYHSGRRPDQHQRIAHVGGQIADGAFGERSGFIGRLRVEHGRRGAHLDALRGVADHQCGVELPCLAGHQRQAGLNKTLEAFGFDRDFKRSRLQLRNRIAAIGASLGLAHVIGFEVANFDGGAGNSRARRIGDQPAQAGREDLGHRKRRDNQRQRDAAGHESCLVMFHF